MEDKMRMISQSELLRLTRTELMVLLCSTAYDLPNLAEGSIEPRNVHANLPNIRMALAARMAPALMSVCGRRRRVQFSFSLIA
jgi:hypothetical protein